MAGDRVLISPVGMMVLHDPMTVAFGNTRDMEKAITTLNEVKESLINAYVKKSGLSRNKVAKLMSEETWLNARKAVEYGFADEILFEDKKEPENDDPDEDDDNTDGDEKDGKKETTIKSYSPVWQFSSKLMEETILNQLSGEDLNEGREQDPTDPEAQEPAEEGVTETTDEVTPDVVEPIEDEATETDKPTDEEEIVEATEKIGEPIDVTGLLSAVDELLAAVDDLFTCLTSHCETVKITADPPKTIVDGKEEKVVPITIGFDGKTEDGSMPYTLLKKQLEYLR